MYPDFIGIGAQRSGTGWLYRNLKKHPDIWLPEVKELHYFDMLDARHTLVDRIGRRRWRRQMLWRIVRDSLPNSPVSLGWDLKYFFGHVNDTWYGFLFPDETGKITGEITPAYSILKRDEVAHVQDVVPDARVIFLICDPVHRAWSQAAWGLVSRRKHKMSEISDKEIKKVFLDPRLLVRGNYLRTLENWESSYPSSRIFIGFYDDIAARPGELLQDIFNFLDIDSDRQSSDADPVRHTKPPMGSAHESHCHQHVFLAEVYYEQLVGLEERFGGWTAAWLDVAEIVLESTDVQLRAMTSKNAAQLYSKR